MPDKIAATRLSQSQIGFSKFVPGIPGAGVDVLVSTVVLSLVSSTAQIVGTTAVFAYRELPPRLSPDPVQVWPALFQLY